MDWQRLKNNKCPKCNSDLLEDKMHTCSNIKCDFMIGDVKFKTIVNSLYKPQAKRDNFRDDNSHGLNNLGYDEMTEGFLDQDPLEDEIVQYE